MLVLYTARWHLWSMKNVVERRVIHRLWEPPRPTTRLLSLSDDLPVRIEVVALGERFDYLIEALDELLDKGLLVAYDVEVIRDIETKP